MHFTVVKRRLQRLQPYRCSYYHRCEFITPIVIMIMRYILYIRIIMISCCTAGMGVSCNVVADYRCTTSAIASANALYIFIKMYVHACGHGGACVCMRGVLSLSPTAVWFPLMEIRTVH